MTNAYAALAADAPLAPHSITRREVGPTDVSIEILFCGVCHSDLHTARGEWGGTQWPCVPGHEIVGRVTAIGADVTSHTVGSMVGVGCLVDSCRECPACEDNLEQYCEAGATWTYNSVDKHVGGVTFGGYSTDVVIDQSFVLRIPESLDPAGAAPLLCAGVTTYSPLRHWNVGHGSRVGVVGLGGLGHMAVKLAHAMGAEVTLFTTSPDKEADARRLGADHVVVTQREGTSVVDAPSLDLIINTVSFPHSLDTYLGALDREGVMVMLGVPPEPNQSPSMMALITRRRSLAGSLIGGIAETQEMLDFCAEHGIVSDIEVIPMHAINEAYERMLKRDVKYRFVIDMATLRHAGNGRAAA